MKNIRKLFAAFTLASMVFALTSCGSSSSYDSAASLNYKSEWADEWEYAAESEGVAYDYDVTAPTEVYSQTQSSGAAAAKNDLSERKIIRNASLSYETKEYDSFVSAINSLITSNGGYVESSEAYGGGVYSTSSYKRNLHITARIPADFYDSFMSAAGSMDIGALTYKNESSEDVTMSYVDTQSHINALETEYDALIDILEKAESLEDVIALQSRISEINYQLDSYKSTLRKYDNLVSYCTVSVDISEVYRETVNVAELTFGQKIVKGLRNNLEDIGDDASDFAVWFVTSLPYIIIWAVVIVVFVILVRAIVRSIKKKRAKRLGEKLLKAQAKANGAQNAAETKDGSSENKK